MDITLIFVIIIMSYFCVIFPLQLRRYVLIRRQRANSRRAATANHIIYRRNMVQQNNNNAHISSEEQSDHHFVFNGLHTSPGTESQRDDAAARYLETEHRQQIIDIQREIERQAIRRRDERDANATHLPSNNTNSSSDQDPVAVYRQQIIDLQREIEQQAIRRQHDQRSDTNTPHMPPRLINSSTIRTSIFTITPSSTIGTSSSNINYPYAPPLSPDRYGERHVHLTNRSNSKDDELPSYEQAVAFKSTMETVTISRY